MEYYLRQIHHGIKDPLNIDLNKEQLVVGRCTNSELKKYIQISRQHARFKKVNDVWFVEDLKSLNGVFVNGNRIGEKPVQLEIGDHIGLGLPAVGVESDGYVCSLSVRPVRKKIIVVDLCDESPVIKTEPPDDIPSSSQNDSFGNHHVSDLPSSSGASSSAVHAHPSYNHKGALTRNNDRISSESPSRKPVSSSLNHKHSINSNVNQFCDENSATISKPSSSLNSVEAVKINGNHPNSSNSTNKLTVIGESPVRIIKSSINYQESLSDSGERSNIIFTEKDKSKNVKQNSLLLESAVQSSSISTDHVSSQKNQSLVKIQDDNQSSNKSVLSVSEKTIVKDCHVCVVRCDSDNFKLPSDVRSLTINGDISARKKPRYKITMKKRNRISFFESSSSSDDEGKQNLSKPPVKIRKVSEFPSFSMSPLSSSNNLAETSSHQNKSIMNSNREETMQKDVHSSSLNQVIEPSEFFSELPSGIAKEHVDNIGQNKMINENLTKNKVDTEMGVVDILNNMGYSQPDEDTIITISDDDDEEKYMDFNSSQVVIKQEPLEDEMELNADEDMYDLNSNNKDISNAMDPDETLSESIENIKLFVESTFANQEENPSNGLEASKNVDIEAFSTESQVNNEENLELSNDSSMPEKMASKKAIESSISTFSKEKVVSESDRSSDSDSSVSNHSLVITPSFAKNKKQSKKPENSREIIQKQVEEVKSKGPKSVGKALLIEPQKLNRRPTRLCGRGEWFEDKTTEPAPDPKSVKNKELEGLPRHKEPPKTSSRKKQETTRQSLLNKLQSPNKRVANAVVPARKKPSRPSLKSSENPPLKTKPQREPSTAKKNNPPISRRPNEYASRSAFLLSDMQPVTAKRKPGNQNTQADKKEPVKNAADRMYSHPVPAGPNYVPNREHSQPNYRQPAVVKRTVNVGFGSSYQSKTVPAVAVPPLTTTSVPSASKTSLATNIVPYGHSSARDPRLQRRQNSSDNKCTANKNYGPHNQLNSVNNSTYFRNINYDSNNFPQRSSNMSHYPVGINANLLLPSVSQNNLSLLAAPGYYQPPVIIHSQGHTREPFNQTPTKISFDFMVKRIVESNVKWLSEQKKADEPPPPDIVTGANNLPLFFNSVDHYISSFYPMLMIETWDNLYQESKIIFESENRRAKKFYFTVLSTESKSNMTIYHCESMVNETSFEPSEGNVLLMDIRETETSHQAAHIFSYVFKHRIEDIKGDSITKVWKRAGSMWLDNAKLYRFSVYVKSRKLSPIFHRLMKGNGICSIKNRLRLADALKSFASSPLSHLIIQPNEHDFDVTYQNISPGRDYNYSQMKAIEGIGSEILKQDRKPKIILLQGPPGTGKTHTIIGLLEKLTSNPKFRILVVAPSNAAIDEIGCRLLNLSHPNSRNPARIRFVRVGMRNQINAKLKSYSLDEKASKLLEDYRAKTRKNLQEENEKLRKQIDELKKQKQDYSVERKIKIYQDELKKGEEKLASKNTDYRLLWSYKCQVLRESNVVLSTLGSCGQAILNSCFSPAARDSFSCCVMDECSQCTETEALLPLMFGISKLIMVGDHQQLPATVSSKIAAAYGYERSMFERFHLYFSKYSKFTPIYMLSTQFRMHSEICKFPSKQFYDSMLLTDPHNDIRNETFALHPYIVYDIVDSQESDSSNSKTNCTEAHAIVDICSQIINMDSRSSIGIITPYQAQRTLYSKALGQNSRYKHIEVNTVDGFQGREKDIIIVSCVRANSGTGGIGFLSCPKRLNVAITRACKCLIICIHSNTLVQNEDWRKLIEDARNRHLCISINSYRDMQLIFKATMVKQPKSKRKH